MDCREERASFRGLELAYKRWGDASGRPVLAMHGWLDNAASFDALAPQLGGGLQVVAVDLPGHGKSSGRGPSDAYHFVDWVDVIWELADWLEWDRFSILGHSMGAAIGTLAAPILAERVEKMVLIDGVGPWTNEAEDVVKQLRRALREERTLRGKIGGRYESRDDALDVLARDRHGVPRERLEGLLDRGARQDQAGRWYFDVDPRLKAASRIRLTEQQVLVFLGAIECPVMLVRPRKGWPVDEDVVERRLDAVPELEVLEVEGGHHVHMEAPERLADEVGAFLRA